ncbi:unnamed protein product [Pleuronectes platessa]|uniref:Uncharacterized protein n=1 Tax=Pleuronectes platessa TaxID=8262 RepID=A0A9N7TTG3_PLEPL|nr:unnamed protein product [Pleuronectes platessa]
MQGATPSQTETAQAQRKHIKIHVRSKDSRLQRSEVTKGHSFDQHVACPTRGLNAMDHVYSNDKDSNLDQHQFTWRTNGSTDDAINTTLHVPTWNIMGHM